MGCLDGPTGPMGVSGVAVNDANMAEYPIVVREIGGQNRLGVEDAEDADVDFRDVVVEGYERVALEDCEDGERVGTVVVESGTEIEAVRWED